jgi:alkanesulfonate monooxygenase SsuD/methylene tetrahydromethanopterin reductase-like flavin-dependent oxidoreductase (luciferase family)
MLPTDPWPTSVRQAAWVESLGFDHLWVYDHLSWRHYRDRDWHATVPWLAGVAMATSRIGLGTLVANPHVRHPLSLAKEAMTLDHISGGRLLLGVGAGGTGFDATVFGGPTLTPSQRVDRFQEYVEVLDGLLRTGLEDHAGRWFTVREARLLPGCVTQPRTPFVVAASGVRSMTIAAKYGAAWVTFGDSEAVSDADAFDGVRRQVELFNTQCEHVGSDPETIGRMLLSGMTSERPLHSADTFVEFVSRYATLGFTDVLFHLPRDDDPAWSAPWTVVEEIAERLPELQAIEANRMSGNRMSKDRPV